MGRGRDVAEGPEADDVGSLGICHGVAGAHGVGLAGSREAQGGDAGGQGGGGRAQARGQGRVCQAGGGRVLGMGMVRHEQGGRRLPGAAVAGLTDRPERGTARGPGGRLSDAAAGGSGRCGGWRGARPWRSTACGGAAGRRCGQRRAWGSTACGGAAGRGGRTSWRRGLHGNGRADSGKKRGVDGGRGAADLEADGWEGGGGEAGGEGEERPAAGRSPWRLAAREKKKQRPKPRLKIPC